MLIVVQVFEIETRYESALDTNDISDDYSRSQRRPSGESLRHDWSSKAIPRLRLSSSMNRPIELQPASPLAQVFNSVVTGEDTRLESRTRGISFGPATRRIPLPRMQASEQRHAQEQVDRGLLEPFPFWRDRASISTVHADANGSPSKGTIATAEEELESGGLDTTIIRRLDTMEQRHERIENLLLQLSQSISGIKNSHHL